MGAAASIFSNVPHVVKCIYLSQAPFLKHLTEQQISEIATCFTGEKYAKGKEIQIISRNPELDVFLVGKGEVQLYTKIISGQSDEVRIPERVEFTLCTKKSGDILVSLPQSYRPPNHSIRVDMKRLMSLSFQDKGDKIFHTNILRCRSIQDSIILELQRGRMLKFLIKWPDLEYSLCAMLDVNLTAMFRRMPLFKDVRDMSLIYLNSLVTHCVFKSGKRIISEGEIGNTMFIIVSGKCMSTGNGEKNQDLIGGAHYNTFNIDSRKTIRQVQFDNRNSIYSTARRVSKNEVPVGILKNPSQVEFESGQIFGEIGLLAEFPSLMNVDIKETATFALIQDKTLENYLKIFPEVKKGMYDEIQNRAAQTILSLGISILKSLSKEYTDMIISMGHIRYLHEEEEFLKEGELYSDMWLILAGQIRVLSSAPVSSMDSPRDKKESFLLERGDYFNVKTAFLSCPRSSAVYTSKRSILLSISRDTMQKLMDVSASFKTEVLLISSPKTVTLEGVLCFPVARLALRRFQRAHYASENIDFWESVVSYVSSNQSVRSVKANEILERFIGDKAKEQVNIDSKMKDEIFTRIQNGTFSDGLFSNAKAEVFKIMERDSMPRFVQSDIFNMLLEDLGCQFHY